MLYVGSLMIQHKDTVSRNVGEKVVNEFYKGGGESCHVLFYGSRHSPERIEENKEKNSVKTELNHGRPGL